MLNFLARPQSMLITACSVVSIKIIMNMKLTNTDKTIKAKGFASIQL